MDKATVEKVTKVLRASMEAAYEKLNDASTKNEVVIVDDRGAALQVLSHDKKTLATTFNFAGNGATATGFEKKIAENAIREWGIQASTKSRREYLREHVENMKETLGRLA